MRIEDILTDKKRSVSTAKNEAKKIDELVENLTNGVLDLEAKIDELESSIDQEVIDDSLNGDDASTKTLDQLARLKISKDAREKALKKAVELIDVCKRNIWRAEAMEKRKEAAKLRTEAANRQGITDGLLKKLSDFEKCEYVLEPPDMSLAEGQGSGLLRVYFITIPKTERMINRAKSLEQEAAKLDESAEQMWRVGPAP